MPLIWPCACRFRNDTLIEDTECGYHAATRKRCGEALREGYANGYATALETAAQVADEMDCAMLCGVGHEVGTRIRSLADAPKPALSRSEEK